MRNSYFVEFFACLAAASSGLFIPIVGKQIGLDLFQIGLVASAFSLGTLASYYFFGRLSDSLGNRRGIIRVGMLACAIVFPMQLFMADFFSMAALRFAAGFAFGIYAFPLVAIVSEYGHRKMQIALLSAMGSLGSLFGHLVAGVVADFNKLFVFAGMCFLIGLYFSARMPKVNETRLKVSFFPIALIKKNAAVFSTFFLRHLGANMIWAIFPLYMVSLGASLFWVGLLYASVMVAQVVFAEVAGKLSYKISDAKIIQIGALFSAIAFIGYAFAANFLHLLPAELLIGVAWAFLYTGSLINLTGKNLEKATATALLGDTISLAAIIGPLLGGAVAFFFNDFRAVMYIAFALGIAALAASRKI
ncbi:MAG: MFS transporter [Candidatus Diapherotrites archaeon]|nr:MFS transporter [Candidatus Diapherotrites archaeon]